MRFLKSFYFSKKELCPCDSGQTYEQCCYIRVEKNVNDKEKLNDIRKTFTDKKKVISMCLYPSKERCKSKSIDAHALQNNRILSLLEEKKHLITLNIKKQGIVVGTNRKDFDVIQEFDLCSVNQATTYRCFCKKHDNDLFAPIEKIGCDFDKNNNEQKFIYAYKSFIFEYYKELVVITSMQKLFKKYPSLTKQFMIVKIYRDTKLKIEEMNYYKEIFDKGILLKNYDDFKTEVIEIDGKISIANFACIAPNFDLQGKRIKNVRSKRMRRIFMTIFPTEDKSYILVSYLNEDKEVYNNLIQQIRSEDIEKIKLYFNYITLLYSENIVISPKLWNTFSDFDKKRVTVIANAKDKDFVRFDVSFSMLMKNVHRNNIKLDSSKSSVNLLR